MSGFEGLDFPAAMSRTAREQLFALAEDVQLAPGDTLITEKREPEAFWLITEGVVEVTSGAWADSTITRVGPGGVVGELSLILDRPAVATVRAVEPGEALKIPADTLADELNRAPALAAEFWRAISTTLAARLAHTTAAGNRLGTSTSSDLPPGLEEVLNQVDDMRRQLDHGEAVPTPVVEKNFEALSAELLAAQDSPVDFTDVTQTVQDRVMPAVMLSQLGRRIWEQPRGYAGDWETIDMVYGEQPTGVGAVGEAMDRMMLSSAPVRAVRNRRHLLAQEIAAAGADRQASVTTVASGPAQEVFDVLTTQPERIREANLLDIDPSAINLVTTKAKAERVDHIVSAHKANPIKLALGRSCLDLQSQDLVYSLGLIDYFPDQLVVKLLDVIHGWLAPGGKVMLGNFHPDNPQRSFMDLIGWKLIHRTEEDMNRIYRESAFGSDCGEFLWEDEHIDLFAVATKR